MRNDKDNVTPDPTDIQITIKDYYEHLYTHKLEILEEMNKRRAGTIPTETIPNNTKSGNPL